MLPAFAIFLFSFSINDVLLVFVDNAICDLGFIFVPSRRRIAHIDHVAFKTIKIQESVKRVAMGFRLSRS